MGQHFQHRQLSGLIWAWALLALSMAPAAAQEGTAAAPPKADAAAAPPAVTDSAAERSPDMRPPADEPITGEVLPEVYYLPDKDGRLQAVPGFSLERFLELYKLQNRLDDQDRPAAFSISAISIAGTADAQRGDLLADFTIAVHESGWVRVPLRLPGAFLREAAVFEGPGEHVTGLASDGSGYVVWIRAEPETTHHVKLRLGVELTQIGSESHLRMTLPRSALSQLKLQVPLKKVAARISEGSTLESVQPAANGASMLTALGLRGEFDLAWQAVETQVASLPTVLEATGNISIRIDGRNVNSEAKLTLRSSGGEFDSFRVRLPPDAEYVPTPQIGATVVSVDDEGGKLCEVRLARKTTGPFEVRLVTQRPYVPQPDGEALQLAGFDVIDAVRQWGTIAVQVSGNWQIQWTETRHVQQIDEQAIFGRAEPTATFEYSVQPYSLRAHVKSQETHVRVEGDYVVLLDRDEAELRAKLKYAIRGAKVRALEVDAPGWDIDLIGPGTLVNVDALAVGQNNPLVIPLLQAVSGEFEVTFTARQKIMPESGAVSLRVPVPHGQSVGAANVTIVPADNVELLVEPEATTDLVTQSVRPKSLDLPERQQEPLYLRTSGPAPTFVASLKVHRQELSTSIAAEVDIDDHAAQVDERMIHQISYEPTDHLLVAVPRVLRPDMLAITLDGQRLASSVAREPSDDGASAMVPMRLALPAPRIGRCEVQIKYSVPHDELAHGASTLVEVPLVIPGEGALTANELSIVPAAGISVSYPKGPWTTNARAQRSAGSADVMLSATSALAGVKLAVRSNERPMEQATMIEQAWIQTRLTDSRRQDRAVFRITTSEPALRLILPNGADLLSREVLVDGRRVQPELDLKGDSRELVIPLAGQSHAPRLLELQYHFAERPPVGDLTVDAPQFQSAPWIQQLYWELLLPSTEHVLVPPTGFAREYRWSWSNLFWHREPSLSDRDLENWIGATRSTDPVRLDSAGANAPAARRPAQAASINHYLFSTVGTVQSLHLHTLSRARLVLFASLPILVCGLALIYFPAARHPAALLVAAVAIAAIGFVDPESAVLLAQAASLGLVLAVVAFVLARLSARPATAATAPVRGSSQAIERPLSDDYPRGVASVSQPSTATNPLVPSTAPESNS